MADGGYFNPPPPRYSPPVGGVRSRSCLTFQWPPQILEGIVWGTPQSLRHSSSNQSPVHPTIDSGPPSSYLSIEVSLASANPWGSIRYFWRLQESGSLKRPKLGLFLVYSDPSSERKDRIRPSGGMDRGQPSSGSGEIRI